VAVASKKKAKKVAKKNGAGKDDAGEDRATSKPTRAVKAKKKAAQRNGAVKSKGKRAAEKLEKARGCGTTRKKKAVGTGEQELGPFEAAKRRVEGSVSEIVEAMVVRAKRGSCTHAKTLLEMTGAKHMFDGEAEGRESGEPWAKLVLERLDEADSDGEREKPRLEEESREVAVAE
jgi:hypothetical protein